MSHPHQIKKSHANKAKDPILHLADKVAMALINPLEATVERLQGLNLPRFTWAIVGAAMFASIMLAAPAFVESVVTTWTIFGMAVFVAVPLILAAVRKINK